MTLPSVQFKTWRSFYIFATYRVCYVRSFKNSEAGLILQRSMAWRLMSGRGSRLHNQWAKLRWMIVDDLTSYQFLPNTQAFAAQAFNTVAKQTSLPPGCEGSSGYEAMKHLAPSRHHLQTSLLFDTTTGTCQWQGYLCGGRWKTILVMYVDVCVSCGCCGSKSS